MELKALEGGVEKFDEGVGVGLVDAVSAGLSILGDAVCAEELVPHRYVRCVVGADGVGFVGVVPMMKVGCGDDQVERSKSPAHVGVEEEADNDLGNRDSTGHVGREAGGNEEHDRWPNQHTVKGMNPHTAQPVEFSSGVVDRMESPQECSFVRKPMDPVAAQVEQDSADDNEGRTGNHRNSWSQQESGNPGETQHPGHGGNDESGEGQQRCCESECEIGAEPVPSDLLSSVSGP